MMPCGEGIRGRAVGAQDDAFGRDVTCRDRRGRPSSLYRVSLSATPPAKMYVASELLADPAVALA